MARRILFISLLIPTVLGLTAVPASAVTFTVNSTDDDTDAGGCEVSPGDCTLREAITIANVDSAQDTIEFNITPDTITLASQLPFVFQPLIIDGTTDPDSSRVRIDGSAVAGDSHGLHFETSGVSAVKGLEIVGLTGTGAQGILGAVSGNGTFTVGGTGANEGNVLSGNGGRGLFLQGFGGTYIVLGNIIGLQADGTTVQANGQGGALVQGNNSVVGGTIGVTPGGACTGACNLISGNNGVGLSISSAATVQGNYIGTDVTGLLDRGNQAAGMSMSGAVDAVIGGDAPDERNVISGNNSQAINFSDVNARQATITGNYIGVGTDGTTALGNLGDGIILGGDDVIVGGTSAGTGNVIANSGGHGVRIFDPGTGGDPTAHDNAIRGNSIFNNGGLGIDLGPPNVTLNDVGDGDSGSNGLQNFPVVSAAEVVGGVVAVQGTLNSVGSSSFDIDIYADATCNAAAPNDHGEGRTYLGSTTATTDGSGDTSFSFTSSGSPSVSLGDVITATATDPSGNTSEFSKCKITTAPQPDLSIDNVTVTEGNSGTVIAAFNVTRSGDLAGSSSVDFATANGTATSPSDFQSTSGTLDFSVMDATEQIDVTINGDVLDEPNETFEVNLSNAVGADIIDDMGQGTITDDDPTPSVSIADATVTEGNAGAVTASFAVTLSSQSGGTVTLAYATANGTATAPSDYSTKSGVVTFGPADTGEQVTVTVNGDGSFEADETFLVNLSDPSGATLGDAQATGTITNDDFCPGFESDPRPQLVGTEGPDVLTGTSAAEIVCGLGGNDVLKAGGGKDLILGGAGNDRMAGQGGKDVLKGQAGNDKMNGGPGVDRCQGGPGKDTARACEKGRA